ncbi:MAG: 50S ribosomal protein L21 [Longimicrobiales bacterium]
MTRASAFLNLSGYTATVFDVIEAHMYALFRTGGKQFRAVPGRKIRIPSLDAAPGDTVTFDEVLLASDGESVSVGQPLVDGASVTAEVIQHGRDKKLVIFKRKRRKGYRKKAGHRQGFTEVRVEQIAL